MDLSRGHRRLTTQREGIVAVLVADRFVFRHHSTA
jgi:hypothetical protein